MFETVASTSGSTSPEINIYQQMETVEGLTFYPMDHLERVISRDHLRIGSMLPEFVSAGGSLPEIYYLHAEFFPVCRW